MSNTCDANIKGIKVLHSIQKPIARAKSEPDATTALEFAPELEVC